MKTIILILGLLTLNQSIAKNKIYKWTDVNGNVHYSQDKPQDTVVNEVKINKGKSKSKTVEKVASEIISEAPETKSADEKAIDDYNKNEQARAAKNQNKENCKIAKKNLATLQKTRRIRKIDPETGESIQMDDSQRIAALKSAKKLISDICK